MTPVTNRNPTEQMAPPKPITPAQNSVTCRSVGCARSFTQTQNFKRRKDAPLNCASSDSTDAPATLRPERNTRHRQPADGGTGAVPSHSKSGTTRRSSLQCLFSSRIGDGHNAFGARFGQIDPLVSRILGGEPFLVLRQVFGADLDRLGEGFPIAAGLCRCVEFVP